MKKRFLVLLAVAAVLVSAFGVVALAQGINNPDDGCYVHGDINGDGVVDNQDAVYALYHSFPLFQEEFPVEQNADFNKDGVVDGKDAMHLMHAAAGDEGYELKGEVHAYGEPVWAWNVQDGQAAVTATVVCPCGSKVVYTERDEITVTEGSMSEVGCLTPGVEEYFARLTVGGVLYSDIWTNETPARGGHTFHVEDCTQEVMCQYCDAIQAPGTHTWVLSQDPAKTFEATCYTLGNEHYVCSGCGQTQDVELAMVSHTYEYLESRQLGSCQFAKFYRCSVPGCGNEIMGEAVEDTFYQHTYTAALTAEPNCIETGIKTFTCGTCSHSYTETVEANGVHVWDEGVTANGEITYTCTVYGCGQTKVVAAVVSGAAVTTENLAGDGVEIQSDDADVNGAGLILDQDAINGLDAQQEITVSVEKADVSSLGLSEDQQAQIAGIVYDFTLTNGGENVSEFDGNITVSLPYELQAGDDVDCIDVWFIADDGTLTVQQGTYSNGFVTFQTNHFSYYTVTRLTAKERCQAYGHTWETSISIATCHQEGFDLKACQRCGESEKSNPVARKEHNFLPNGGYQPTCTEAGMEELRCEHCGDIRTKILPATGHSHEKVESECVAATCTASGLEVLVCSCGDRKEVTIARLSHSFTKKESQTVSCETQGYDLYVCSNEGCGAEEKRNVLAATGHKWAVSEEGWVWNEDHTKATMTLVCGNDDQHTKVLSGVITEKTETSVCLGGAITYTATTSFAGQQYTDTVTIAVEAPGHVAAAVWDQTEEGHSRECMVCKEIMDKGAHTFSEKVTKAPTCNTTGIKTKTCDLCGYSVSSLIEATGVHSFVGGTCSSCGLKESGCDHELTELVTIDLAQYGICDGKVVMFSCQCGQHTDPMEVISTCAYGEPKNERVEGEMGEHYTVTVTCGKCGAVRVDSQYNKAVEGQCKVEVVAGLTISVDGVSVVDVEKVVHSQPHYTYKAVQTYDMAQLGLCEGTLVYSSCSCGMAKDWSIKDSECVWDHNEAGEYCIECGVQRLILGDEEEIKEGCLSRYEYVFKLVKGETTLLSLDCCAYYDSHEYEVDSWELLGDSCTEGLKVVNICKTCGEHYDYVTTQHAPVLKEEMDLTGYGMCAAKLVTTECPCQEHFVDFNFVSEEGKNHEWSYDRYSDTGIHGFCDICGWEVTAEVTHGQKDANCKRATTFEYTFENEAGKTIEVTRMQEEYDHNWEYSYKLKGSSCTDGVIVYETCKDCGASSANEFTNHVALQLEHLDFSGEDTCFDGVVFYGCPCGDERWVQYEVSDSYCEMRYVSGDANCHTESCRVCGLTITEESRLVAAIDSCHEKHHEKHTFSKDGKALGELEFDRIYTYHRTVAKVTHVSGGNSCQNGTFSVEETCTVCGECVADYLLHPDEYHMTHVVKRELVSQGQLCGDIELITTQCACGAEGEIRMEWTGNECQMEWAGTEKDYDIWHCMDCGVIEKIKSTSSEVPGAPCRFQDKTNYIFIKDGKTLVAFDTASIYTSHMYIHSFDGTCGDESCKVSYVCLKCGDSSTETWYDHDHYEGTLGVVDVGAAGGCDTVYEQQGCVCGEYGGIFNRRNACDYSYSYDSYTDAKGSHHVETATCRICGLVKVNDTLRTDAEGCYENVDVTIEFTLNGKQIGRLHSSHKEDSHRYQLSSAELMDGARTCEDGVLVTYSCIDCGRSYSYDTDYHAMKVVNSEDLAPYGAVCGAKLELSQCACGRSRTYGISDDSQCDIYQRATEPFEVDGTVFTGIFEQAMGGSFYFDEFYYDYFCSVTEPQCGLKLRKARVWLVEGCELVEYEIWQLGYDEESDTCMKTVKEPTGRRTGYHKYTTEETTVWETETRQINTWNSVCEACGSTHTRRCVYENSYLIRQELQIVNKSCAKEAAQWTYVVDYTTAVALSGGTYAIDTVTMETFLYADGTSYWTRLERTFDEGTTCTGTYVETDSDGSYYQDRFERHNTTFTYEMLQQPTCSQEGMMHEQHTCVICGVVTEQQINDLQPTDHNWNLVNGVYTCSNCGLENSNGASGSIVLEQISDKGAAETVIGYWNRGEIQFIPVLTVVLNDAAEGTDDQLDVAGVEIRFLNKMNDGVQAVAWESAQAKAAAEAAVAQAGYKGSYALKITFVPVNSGDTLDYAITFDSQVAE